MPIPAFINDELVRESGRIAGYAVERMRTQSPWATLMNKGLFESGMGVTHTSVLYERTIPSETYDWAAVSVNNGAGNSCVPNADTILNASTEYTHSLNERAFNSQRFCWNDLYTAWQVKDQIRQIVSNFTGNIVDVWENRDRDQYVSISQHKCIFSGGTLIDQANSFALTTPDSYATPDLMDEVYQRLLQDGADMESEVGKADGASVFMLYLGFEQSRALVKGNEGVRDDVRWSSEVDSLLKPFSVKRVLNGWAHMIDVKAPRWNFTAGAWVRVPFWTTDGNATIGTRAVVNPAYQSAGYEDLIVYLRNVAQREMPRSMGSFGEGTSFNVQDFAGNIQWRNILSETENPDGNIGFFRAVLQAAYRQLNPNLGYCIRVKRCPNQLNRETCTGS